MSDEELKQLAIDYRAGRIFTDRQCDTPDELRSCFMVLVFLDQEAIAEMKTAGMIYEYMTNAGPRTCNGKPIFFSFRTLRKEEVPKLAGWVEKLAAAEAAL